VGAQELTLGAVGNKVGAPPETSGDKIEALISIAYVVLRKGDIAAKIGRKI